MAVNAQLSDLKRNHHKEREGNREIKGNIERISRGIPNERKLGETDKKIRENERRRLETKRERKEKTRRLEDKGLSCGRVSEISPFCWCTLQ